MKLSLLHCLFVASATAVFLGFVTAPASSQDDLFVKRLMFEKGVATFDGEISDDDGKDPVHKQLCKVFTVRLLARRTYQIDMVSKKIDTYLRLENVDGKELAHDDDSGGVTNARIVFTCPQEAMYRIFASTSVGGTGPFKLTIRIR
jgi:hypothetical protein